ncbi:hypothetical protein [Paraburkholderia sp. J12]|uniref:hypothetical protein n=1 Tax=Paraburkholderia sp. J12 TaxID=2805432 RepID=UPI002ABDBE2E|nr:hypothetical protein [Paraburkholderia sp. J12]
MRSYEYNGFMFEISVETDTKIQADRRTPLRHGFVAIVRIFKEGNAIAIFSPLRFGEAGGRPFATEADALMGGHSAARKIVDDLFSRDRP